MRYGENSYVLRTPEQCHCRNEAIGVVGIKRDVGPIDLDHFVRANRIQIVDCDTARAEYFEYPVLADLDSGRVSNRLPIAGKFYGAMCIPLLRPDSSTPWSSR